MMPGGDAICHGHHVWGGRAGDECQRCGLVNVEPKPRPLCPECRDGKPQNCIGWTLDADDNEVPCAVLENRSQ